MYVSCAVDVLFELKIFQLNKCIKLMKLLLFYSCNLVLRHALITTIRVFDVRSREFEQR